MHQYIRAKWSNNGEDWEKGRVYDAKPHEAIREMLQSLEEDPRYDEDECDLHKIEVC